MPLNIHYLRVFSAVMTEHSLAHAALDMHTSHSNVKRMVEVLERELGIPLFHRSGRGIYEPTDNAKVLNQEMSRFLAEIDEFEGRIKNSEQSRKTLRIGAESWFMETEYFVRLFQQLRRDGAYRPSIVEVAAGEEKQALESGHCDLLIGSHAPVSRRLHAIELPSTRWYAGKPQTCRQPKGGGELDHLGERWGMYFPASRERGNEFIRQIEKAHGGKGCLISAPELRAWQTDRAGNALSAVVAAAPAMAMTQQAVDWHPLSPECACPVNAVYLSQHPYGCLRQLVHVMLYEMKRAAA